VRQGRDTAPGLARSSPRVRSASMPGPSQPASAYAVELEALLSSLQPREGGRQRSGGSGRSNRLPSALYTSHLRTATCSAKVCARDWGQQVPARLAWDVHFDSMCTSQYICTSCTPTAQAEQESGSNATLARALTDSLGRAMVLPQREVQAYPLLSPGAANPALLSFASATCVHGCVLMLSTLDCLLVPDEDGVGAEGTSRPSSSPQLLLTPRLTVAARQACVSMLTSPPESLGTGIKLTVALHEHLPADSVQADDLQPAGASPLPSDASAAHNMACTALCFMQAQQGSPPITDTLPYWDQLGTPRAVWMEPACVTRGAATRIALLLRFGGAADGERRTRHGCPPAAARVVVSNAAGVALLDQEVQFEPLVAGQPHAGSSSSSSSSSSASAGSDGTTDRVHQAGFQVDAPSQAATAASNSLQMLRCAAAVMYLLPSVAYVHASCAGWMLQVFCP
jgi:hypothetical protein